MIMATSSNRPLSPHLQVYRLPLTGIISITHRLTGIFLSIGLLGLVWILALFANGSGDFNALQAILNMWPCRIIYWGFVFALCFHLCHGIRHLIWDSGNSFDKLTLNYFAGIELLCVLGLFGGVMLFF
jgi:succinate dehydrogenase / fumarate reductase, cytochrome b subunit